MSVVVFVNTTDSKVNKAGNEAVFYGKKVAEKIGGEVIVVSYGSASEADLGALGEYGASKVVVARNVSAFDPQQIGKVISQVTEENNASVVVFSQDIPGKAIAPRVSVRLNAGHVSGAIDVPNTDEGFKVKKNVFSGKAFAEYEIHTEKKIISLVPNSFKPEKVGSAAAVSEISPEVGVSKIIIKETKKAGDGVPLPEAELVVSAGRGLKGPENWGMVEELAQELGATTACSRPVSDMGWRPHHEHVGQTGVAIGPNLYIAIGISGAIQHLAGVNRSKVIVVVNTDPDAPFFKAADYGIVGDAFEVVPKLVEAVKEFKSQAIG